MIRLRKSKAPQEGSERRDETVALLLLVLAVIAGVIIALLLGDSIAFPHG